MDNFNHLITSITLFGIITSCDYSDVDTRMHPAVETAKIEINDTNEVLMEGKAIQNLGQPIIDHGFIWNLQEEVNEGYYDQISLGSLNTESFNAKIDHGLISNYEYYVRAYAKTNESIVFGNAIKFNPKNTLTPVVEGFIPMFGVPGDTITLYGKNLSTNSAISELRIGSTGKSKIIGGSSTAIQVIALVSGNLDYRFEKYTWYSQEQFNILNRVYTNYYPTRGTACDVITIEGTNFGNGLHYNMIEISETPAKLITATKSKIHFYVPPVLPYNSAGDRMIKHTVGFQTLGLLFYYDFIPIPSISGLTSATASQGELLTINGNNIPFCSDESILVFLKDTSIILSLKKISATKNQITVQIPTAVNKGQYTLLVKVLDKEFNLSVGIN